MAAACLAWLAGAGAASAQPRRPEVFYVLSRQALPPLDPAELPEDARGPYRAMVEGTARLKEALASRPRDRSTIERLDAELRRIEGRLRAELARGPATLSAQGWLLLGELLAAADIDGWSEALDRAAERGEEGPELDLSDAVDAWRRAAAIARSPATAAWARYAEAWAWVEMSQLDEGRRALSAVAASGHEALAAEARLRLGELAFDAGRYGVAAGWYGRALPSLPAELRPVAVYKRVWALARTGRGEEAREVAATLGDEAPREIRDELRELLAGSER